jgi:hypothetical protein
MPAQTFHKIYAEWEEKLAQSGFVDIEIKCKDKSGRFNPTFAVGQTSATTSNHYSPITAFYYTACDHFITDFNWVKHFKGRVLLYKYLFYLHSEAVSYRVMALLLQGKNPPKQWKHVRKPSKTVQQVRSIYYISHIIHQILPHFHKYLKQNHNVEAKRSRLFDEKSRASLKRKRFGKLPAPKPSFK